MVDVMESLTPEQYRQMVKKVIDFKRLNGKLPESTVIDGCRIIKKDYIDMIEMVNKFYLETGRNPGLVEIGSGDQHCNNRENLLIH
ncbi:MAG TPA: pseudomurein-binding repeat-containing protein [Methanobacteriaceae archaeon]|nr:pseudomurein-binding repeat-containing protein [Methanobacteriaceae archaeon]